jgi:DNA-binding SARP family transcriptional activator/Tfp pilus assembly protein PilF
MADHEVRFHILGPLQVTRDGRPLDVPKSAVLRGVLGVLLLADGEPLSVHRLAATVWQDHDGQVSRGAVQVGVSRLRAWVSSIAGATTAVSVEHAADGYRLITAPDTVDLARLRTLVVAAEGTADPVHRYDLLLSAMQLRRGAVLADLVSVDMSDPLFRAADDAIRDCALAFAAAALAVDRPGEAVPHLEGLAEIAPFDEPIHASLIDLLAAAEQPAAALVHYERLRSRLADEYGVAPSETAQHAHLNVLARDRPIEPSAAEQLTRSTAPAQLPIGAAGFTGRTAELARLDGLMPPVDDSGGARTTVVAINGTAGVGKTALAAHWAHRIRDRFAGGQLYVNLRGFAPTGPMDPLEALAGFLRALGEPAENIPADTDEAAALYRTRLADTRALVMLDDARDVEQIRPLLPASSGCLVLVTSRNRLGGLVAREGAHRITLDVLTVQEAIELLTNILGAERVRAEPSATQDHARACANLPLALRIAAANIIERRARSIGDYVAELADGNRLAALHVEGDEHSAIRAAFNLSYAALDPEAQRMFRVLGLLPGNDVGVDGAAALAGTPPGTARRILDRLASAALIVEHEPGRYAFHDLLRLYAAECAHSDPSADREGACERYFEWYLRNVDAVARQLYPYLVRLTHIAPDARLSVPVAKFDDSGRAGAWLDAEWANILAVITQTTAHGPRRVAWLLADALRGYCWLSVSPIEWRMIAEAGVTAASAEGDLQDRAACHQILGELHRRCSRYQEAVEQYEETARLSDADGWLTGRAAAVSGLCATYWMMGELRQAADHGHKAFELSQELRLATTQSTTLGYLGMTYRAMGCLLEAAEYHQRALVIDREVGNRVNESLNLTHLGAAYHALGRSEEALDCLNQALQCLEHRNAQGATYHVLAVVHRDYHRLDQALDCVRTALVMARDRGERRLEAEALNTLASICLGRADYAEAAKHHRQALVLTRATGSKYAETEALLGLASAEQHLNEGDKALARIQHAVVLARHGEYRILKGLAHTIRAELYRTQERHADAMAEARRALTIHQETGYRLGVARTLVVLASEPAGITGDGL